MKTTSVHAWEFFAVVGIAVVLLYILYQAYQSASTAASSASVGGEAALDSLADSNSGPIPWALGLLGYGSSGN